jgi:hypothetical protein
MTTFAGVTVPLIIGAKPPIAARAIARPLK